MSQLEEIDDRKKYLKTELKKINPDNFVLKEIETE